MAKSEVVATFKEHNADDIGTMVGVCGWVPADQVDSLLEEVPSAYVQYGHETEKMVATEKEWG